MIRYPTMLAVVLGLVTMAGCSNADPSPSEETPPRSETALTRDAEPPQNDPRQQPTVPLELTQADWRGLKLEGELGCAFSPAPGAAPLLFATGIVGSDRPAEAAIKLSADGPVKLTMDGAGGFGALAQGGLFTGADDTFAEIVTSGDPIAEQPQVAMESPRYAATLKIGRGAQSVTMNGVWECGP
ncbi:hypothetical protein [Qipengyuania spongiae]|uniref:Lipoprotein n=1 Tax=Qipengyuania spongiae TaxID=2909673 RepID=A0ABY5T262_9SPHN|nr:hypothetical protein [Qipengyuania spongiae]UVI39421.1 hypothetical protein L1F33_00160 [Qipengyuania spongiae]